MSHERQHRRAAREREAAVKAAARAAEAERRERTEARRRRLTSWLPSAGPKVRRPTGVLAERARRRNAAAVGLLAAVVVLVWVIRPDAGARVGALVLAVLAFPVVRLFLSDHR